MPIDRKRYPKNWNQIAEYAKDAAGWRCQHCQRLCLRPGEKPPHLTRSEWTKATLSTHHANFTPEDNQPQNLIPLCTPCHKALHARAKRSNVSRPAAVALGDFTQYRYKSPMAHAIAISLFGSETRSGSGGERALNLT